MVDLSDSVGQRARIADGLSKVASALPRSVSSHAVSARKCHLAHRAQPLQVKMGLEMPHQPTLLQRRRAASPLAVCCVIRFPFEDHAMGTCQVVLDGIFFGGDPIVAALPATAEERRIPDVREGWEFDRLQ